jgi:hypothetical protein
MEGPWTSGMAQAGLVNKKPAAPVKDAGLVLQ